MSHTGIRRGLLLLLRRSSPAIAREPGAFAQGSQQVGIFPFPAFSWLLLEKEAISSFLLLRVWA